MVPSAENLSGSDNRYLPRWEVTNRVVFHLDDQNHHPLEGQTRDLHCEGACILVNRELKPRQRLKLNIELDKNITVDLQGFVSWCKTSGGQNLVGITFTDTSDAQKDLIFQHAFELNRDEFVKKWFNGWDK